MRRALLLLSAAAGVWACGGDTTKPPATPCSGSGIACVWAGTGEQGYNNDGHDKLATTLYWPLDVTFAPDGTPYFIDWNNYSIRRVKPDQTVETVVGQAFPGDGPPTDPPAVPADMTPAGADGTTVLLNHPTQVVFAPDGTMYLDAWHNHKIRTWDPATGLVHVLCGKGFGFAGDGGPAAKALFSQPKSIALGPSGELYILDQRNERIRKIDSGTSPNIETVVGSGVQGWNGDDKALLETQLNFEKGPNPEPNGALALTKDGNTLFIADTHNNRIRRVDFVAGTITTVAGTGDAGYGGDGGPALQAKLNLPRYFQLTPDEKKLYVADTDNSRIRLIDLTAGTISLVAGSGEPGNQAGVPAAQAQLNRPFGVALDASGNLFIADTLNDWILEVAP